MAKIRPLSTEVHLRQSIQQELAKCDEATAPELCRRIWTPEGYRHVEDTIIGMILTQGLTPAACVELLKSEYEA